MASKLHARSLRWLEARGWEPGTVERRMAAFRPSKTPGEKGEVTPFGRTVDLWGWCDLVAYSPATHELAFVQVCAAGDAAKHRAKIEAWAPMRYFIQTPLSTYVHVDLHVWKKRKGCYELKVERLLPELPGCHSAFCWREHTYLTLPRLTWEENPSTPPTKTTSRKSARPPGPT